MPQLIRPGSPASQQVNELRYDRAADRIYNPEIRSQQKHGSDDHTGCGAHLLPGRPGYPAHLRLHFFDIRFRLLRPPMEAVGLRFPPDFSTTKEMVAIVPYRLLNRYR